MRHVLLVVAVGRRVGPAEAAQVGRDHAVVLGERRDLVAPLVPVLRPAVQEQDRVGVGRRRPRRRASAGRPHRRSVCSTPSTWGNGLAINVRSLPGRRRCKIDCKSAKRNETCRARNVMEDRLQKISAVLHEAAETHHVVYRITDGDDPDWASWYADWLVNHSELPDLLGTKPVRSELVYMLVLLDKDYSAESPDEKFEDYYARASRGTLRGMSERDSRRRRLRRDRGHRPPGRRLPGRAGRGDGGALGGGGARPREARAGARRGRRHRAGDDRRRPRRPGLARGDGLPHEGRAEPRRPLHALRAAGDRGVRRAAAPTTST